MSRYPGCSRQLEATLEYSLVKLRFKVAKSRQREGGQESKIVQVK